MKLLDGPPGSHRFRRVAIQQLGGNQASAYADMAYLAHINERGQIEAVADRICREATD